MKTPLRPPLKSDLHNPGRQTRMNRFMGIAHTGSGNINIFALSGDAKAKERNRQRMLERVKRFWVQGVLDQSVQQQTTALSHQLTGGSQPGGASSGVRL